jgi:hypothetical protein
VSTGGGDAELDELTRLFGEELRGLDVGSVELTESANLPQGSKAIALAAIDTMLRTVTAGAR